MSTSSSFNTSKGLNDYLSLSSGRSYKYKENHARRLLKDKALKKEDFVSREITTKKDSRSPSSIKTANGDEEQCESCVALPISDKLLSHDLSTVAFNGQRYSLKSCCS